jgi:hypothetical protein
VGNCMGHTKANRWRPRRKWSQYFHHRVLDSIAAFGLALRMRGAALQLLGAPIHRLQDRSRSRIVRNCGRGDLFLPQIPLSFRRRRMGRSLLHGFR